MTGKWVCAFFILSIYFSPTAQSKSSVSSTFSDLKLQGIFEKSRLQPKELFIIYSWSPHMNLSLIGLENFRSKKNVTFVMDPSAHQKTAERSFKEMNLNKDLLARNKSKRLIELGTLTHYPNYVFIKNGQFVGGILPGYKSETALNRYIASVLNKRP